MLVEGHEAHDVPCGWPRLRLAQRSNPLRPIRVGDRTEKAVVDKRLQRLHGHIGRIPRIRREDDRRTAGHCVMENGGYGGKSLSLLSLSRSLFSLLLPGALCSRQWLEGGKGEYGQGKEGMVETRFIFMQGGRNSQAMKLGKFPSSPGTVNPDPISPPTRPPFPH